MFETLGIAKGSHLIGKNAELPDGNLERLALYPNGAELDDKVYKDCDVNHAIEKIQQFIGDSFKMFSYWTGSEETALYFYGTSFDPMKKSVDPFIAKYPLYEKSRITQSQLHTSRLLTRNLKQRLKKTVNNGY